MGVAFVSWHVNLFVYLGHGVWWSGLFFSFSKLFSSVRLGAPQAVKSLQNLFGALL